MVDEIRLNDSVGLVETQNTTVVEADNPLLLQCGKKLGPIEVAYETYGTLNAAGDNAIYICHALTGNAHVAGYNSLDDRKPGWWNDFVGPGKYIDTDKYFVVCSNILGGCSGTTGPSSINPDTGEPYGLDFPMFTIADMVKVQKLLVDKLGIKQLLAVVGGSMGGMHAMQWTIDYPDFVKAAVLIATTTHLSPQSIAFDAVGRNAILADPQFNGGRYNEGQGPDKGLSIARMIGHITYLSEEGMRNKFGRSLRESSDYNFDFNPEFSVETYLDHQGRRFVERFDANCYLYITRAMDYYDVAKDYSSLEKAFENSNCRFMVVSFSSDWLFTPKQSEELVDSLSRIGKDVSYFNIESNYGHDAFLIESDKLGPIVSNFIEATYSQKKGGRNEASNKNKAIPTQCTQKTRSDYDLIEAVIEGRSKVLDVGCGDGELLARLKNDKDIIARGIEFDIENAAKCLAPGLAVLHRDVERGLAMYADDSFDYVLLSQTLQTLKDPEAAFKEMLRVGKRIIISFPNFAYYRCRLQIMFNGVAPVTRQLPFGWYNSPNIHFLSLRDFEKFCHKLDAKIEKKIPLGRNGKIVSAIAPNALATQAIYVASKR
ncbi:MAG: homoserine O-acetyltransferase [Sedimentisphaeraceae bacterium JB056]